MISGGRQAEVLHHQQRLNHEGRQRTQTLGHQTFSGDEF